MISKSVTPPRSHPQFNQKYHFWWRVVGFITSIIIITVLGGLSVIIGVADISTEINKVNLSYYIKSLLNNDITPDAGLNILFVSRIPRTIALILAGASLSVSGLIMQMLVQNRFVEPTTAGAASFATLGILFVTLTFPNIAIMYKMLIASLFALFGTFVFILLLKRIPLRSILMVPLIGMILSGIIDSISSFFAYKYQLLQSLAAWTNGDFSSVLMGRYELLWVGFVLSIIAYIFANKFTVAGMGEAFTKNLGLNYHQIFFLGLFIVAMITGVVAVTVGVIPFIGFVVPNLVAMAIGDNVRRNIPWVAVTGTCLVLSCDIIGRLIRYPYEIPVGTIIGVLGCLTFLYLLLKRNNNFG